MTMQACERPQGAIPSLTASFHSWISTSIDASGVSPSPLFILTTDGSLEIHALAVPFGQAILHILKQSLCDTTAELIYGIDRFTLPGQGTEFRDCVAGAYWVRDAGWSPLVINYQHEPRIVRAIDWSNEFWTGTVLRELDATRLRHGPDTPPIRRRIHSPNGECAPVSSRPLTPEDAGS